MCGDIHKSKLQLHGIQEERKLMAEDAGCLDGAWCGILEKLALNDEVPIDTAQAVLDMRSVHWTGSRSL